MDMVRRHKGEEKLGSGVSDGRSTDVDSVTVAPLCSPQNVAVGAAW